MRNAPLLIGFLLLCSAGQFAVAKECPLDLKLTSSPDAFLEPKTQRMVSGTIGRTQLIVPDTISLGGLSRRRNRSKGFILNLANRRRSLKKVPRTISGVSSRERKSVHDTISSELKR